MALGRELLKGFGLNDDQQDAIIAAHRETVDALKKEAEKQKKAAEEAQKKLDEANDAAAKDTWKVKYDALKKEADAYKATVEKEKARSTKDAAYRALLKAENVPEKRHDAIMKVTDIDALELGEDGKFTNEKDLRKGIKEDYAEFIPSEEERGVTTQNPPPGSNEPSTANLAFSVAQGYYKDIYGLDINGQEGDKK
jgi:hypothetical protein